MMDKMDPEYKDRMRKLAEKKAKKFSDAYNKMETSKNYKPLPFLGGKMKKAKGGPSDVMTYMKKKKKSK
jgi:hypothetical protein